ncbi:hypothetical protein [Streptomyces sp. BE147]|uniref:hypothetical protein n=1 Tax=unclassified Streptomyces TaxID=2593676 RepID=UPI002E771980|nr:hypothetical protein [Streptomyces sp. BE147]MEE1741581.1 hypothetical protein [Streptomyces sp. BE147]
MNTFLNYLGITAVFVLFLLPTFLGLARERRIDRELGEAEREHGAEPPRTRGAARPVTATRRPSPRSWARI